MTKRTGNSRGPASGRDGDPRAAASPSHPVFRRLLRYVGAVIGFGGPALAQDEVLVQQKVTVTGSRIKRVDIEGPSPITIIDRETIDASGEISVADLLRDQSFNSFGSQRQRSGSSSQSQATVNMRGLGAQRTLVLLDGRRLSGSPTFQSGAATNLNTIPLAAVERIEVLRDGASAIYGSDAIGGVVNIITRKDYEGSTSATASVARRRPAATRTATAS